MSDWMTPDQWQAVEQGLGVKRAQAWREANDIKVNGLDEPDEVSGMDDVDDTGETALSVTPSAASAVTASPFKVDRNAATEDLFSKQRQSLSDLYDQAREKLRSRYSSAMPDRNEMLLQLGAALLRPTENGKFMESLGNAAGALSEFGAGQRTARNALEDKMLEVDLGQAKELNDLNQRYLTAAYKSPRTAIDPTTGTVVNLDTAEPVLPPGTKVLNQTPESLAMWNAAPPGTRFYSPDQGGWVTKPMSQGGQ